jgi:zinc protease
MSPFFSSAVIPKVAKIVTPKGILIWLCEDHSSSVVSIKAAFKKAGNVVDPNGKEGCSLFFSETVLEGAGNLSGREIAEQLENVGGNIEISVDEDTLFFVITYVKQHQHHVLDLAHLILMKPALSAEAVQRVQQRLVANEALQQDDPRVLGERAVHKAAYGDHPYARHPTKASLQAISQQDLIAFKNQRLAKDQLVVVVVGDITAQEAIDCVDGTFGDLPDKASPSEVLHISPRVIKDGVRIQKFLPQSLIFWYQNGVRASDPDFFALQIANRILSGGFRSRLYKKLRIESGLVYVVQTSWDQSACAEIMLGITHTESMDEVIDLIRQEWKLIAQKGVTEEELIEAKKFLNGSFILSFTDCRRISSLLMDYALLDFHPDILQTREKKIEAVTREDVNKVIKQRFTPEALTFISVGP